MPNKHSKYLIFSAILISFFSCEKPRQIVRIVYKHSAGKEFEESEIITWRRDLSLIAQLKTKGKQIKEVTLDEGYIPIIPVFIQELKSIPNEQKCPVTDSYTVYIDNQIINRIDRTCNWNGFSHLKSTLFEN